MSKFEKIVLELKKRKYEVKLRVSTKLGFSIDGIIENTIALFENPRLITLEKAKRLGYDVMIVPEGKLRDEDIMNFCDEMGKELDGKQLVEMVSR